MNHKTANAILTATRPRDAGPRAVLLAQAVALHETGYGGGWARSCPELVGGHNWGAVQGTPGAICGDTHADGSSYRTSYRRYPSDEAGAAGLWHELWKRPAVRRVLMDDALDVDGLATAMRAEGYYEATRASYTVALRRALDTIRRNT